MRQLFLTLVVLLVAGAPAPANASDAGPVNAMPAHVAFDGAANATYAYDFQAAATTPPANTRTDARQARPSLRTASRSSTSRIGRFLAAKGGTRAGAEVASSAAQAARLKTHLSLAERYGAGGIRELQNGRLRYYGQLRPARTPGEMAGQRTVREWDPATGAQRTWLETIDQQGRVRIVRPETGGPKRHFQFDAQGDFIGSW